MKACHVPGKPIAGSIGQKSAARMLGPETSPTQPSRSTGRNALGIGSGASSEYKG